MNKFRGKAVMSIEELDELEIEHENGWVFGYNVDNIILSGIVHIEEDCGALEQWNIVHKDSIGQGTGLHDKNGAEIHQGDIIRFCDCASDRTGGHMGDSIITGFVSYSYTLWLVKENKEDEGGHLLCDAHLNDDELEVIGNIYEHKHLLEGDLNAKRS